MDRKELFPDDGSIYPARAGGALAIRIETPSIQPDGERFKDERAKVTEGIDAVIRLTTWLAANREELERLLRRPYMTKP